MAHGNAGGDAVVRWRGAAGADSYRVGWIAMDSFRCARDAGEPWLEQFRFTNVGGNRREYVVECLAPGVPYAFIVASVPELRDGWPAWPEHWVYLTTPAGLPCPASE